MTDADKPLIVYCFIYSPRTPSVNPRECSMSPTGKAQTSVITREPRCFENDLGNYSTSRRLFGAQGSSGASCLKPPQVKLVMKWPASGGQAIPPDKGNSWGLNICDSFSNRTLVICLVY